MKITIKNASPGFQRVSSAEIPVSAVTAEDRLYRQIKKIARFEPAAYG